MASDDRKRQFRQELSQLFKKFNVRMQVGLAISGSGFIPNITYIYDEDYESENTRQAPTKQTLQD